MATTKHARKRRCAQTMLLLVQLEGTGLDFDGIARAIGSSPRSIYRWYAGETAPIPPLFAALKRLLEERKSASKGELNGRA